ncbi:unnamed protein product, partial [Nesidiocoris tenuis]
MPVPCDVNPPPPANSKQPGVNPSLLYNGSRFQGHQKSKGNSYEVEVVLQPGGVRDCSEQTFYWHRLQDLTGEAAEFLSACCSNVNKQCNLPISAFRRSGDFRNINVFQFSQNPLFNSQSKFASFCQYSKTFNADCFDYDEIKSTDFVFMRWKEHFLVPDHTIRDISGASFAGFYYICFQKSRATIEGYYYHRSSEISSHGIVSPEYAIFQPSTCSKLTPNAFGQCLT